MESNDGRGIGNKEFENRTQAGRTRKTAGGERRRKIQSEGESQRAGGAGRTDRLKDSCWVVLPQRCITINAVLKASDGMALAANLRALTLASNDFR